MMDEDDEPISISIPPVDDGIELPLVMVMVIPVMPVEVDIVMSILLAEDMFLAKITLDVGRLTEVVRDFPFQKKKNDKKQQYILHNTGYIKLLDT